MTQAKHIEIVADDGEDEPDGVITLDWPVVAGIAVVLGFLLLRRRRKNRAAK